jgi:undecaprenyl-diphosphatase
MAARSDIAKRSIRGRVLVLIVFALLLYIIVPQVSSFSDSWRTLGKADWLPVLAASMVTVLTFFVAALTYHLLALKKLYYHRTLLVQGASAFANRILPAGLGGLTLNVQYLRKARFSTPQAIAVAGINNTLGMVGHLLLLLIVLVAAGDAVTDNIMLPAWNIQWYWLLAGAGVIGLVLFVATGLRRSLVKALAMFGRQLLVYRAHKMRVAAALGNSVVLTLLYVVIFYLSAVALGADLTYIQALIVFSAGMLLGTVMPTPGGLGGVEAGLAAGMVAYGHEASLALAVALLYRLITYWLPLIPGFVIFMLTRKYYS